MFKPQVCPISSLKSAFELAVPIVRLISSLDFASNLGKCVSPMIEFKILKKSKHSWARLGLLKTSNGEVETPSLVPVATRASIKTLTSEEAAAAKCRILIANTFHLHLKPGEEIVKKAGGLHNFMNWNRPLMTDSGGFQVFSLGFGRDLKVGKILKGSPGNNNQELVHVGAQPKF